ncbi:hypothetical protein K502DRAFT_144189 [Neoconidiobolus thromboides FSU 785]|nr:hypothetical protein K502DRAFT_144189 [Neoconidiobolus thromboides FSU 785]
MCQNDKDFVLRVQLSQLVSNSDSLKVDDFYFEMLNSFTGTIGNINDKGNEQGNNGRGHKNNELQKMQKQLAKVVADTKRRQENSKKGLENALGKVAQKSSRNPKMVLQVNHQRSPSEGLSSGLDILNGSGANTQVINLKLN